MVWEWFLMLLLLLHVVFVGWVSQHQCHCDQENKRITIGLFGKDVPKTATIPGLRGGTTTVPTKTQLSNFLGTPGEDYFKGNPKSLNFYFLVIWWGKTIWKKTMLPTWSLTASLPLKSSRNPKGKDHLPTIIFQGRAVKLRGCIQRIWQFCKLCNSL